MHFQCILALCKEAITSIMDCLRANGEKYVCPEPWYYIQTVLSILYIYLTRLSFYQLFNKSEHKKRQLIAALSLLFNVGPQSPGTLTAQATIHLSLLSSDPDEVHEIALRETKTLQSDLKKHLFLDKKMAESERFELSVQFPVHTLSRRAPSTTRTTLHV